MKLIRQQLDDAEIYLAVLDEPAEAGPEATTGRRTHTTGLTERLTDLRETVQSTIRHIAESIGTELRKIEPSCRPESTEVEFNLALSAQLGPVWMLGASGNYGMKVKLLWKDDNAEPPRAKNE